MRKTSRRSKGLDLNKLFRMGEYLYRNKELNRKDNGHYGKGYPNG
jgi:hypothetical protein